MLLTEYLAFSGDTRANAVSLSDRSYDGEFYNGRLSGGLGMHLSVCASFSLLLASLTNHHLLTQASLPTDIVPPTNK